MSLNMLDPLFCTYFVEIFDNLRLVGHKEVKKGIKELEARLSGVRVPRGKPRVASVLGNGRRAKHSQNTSLMAPAKTAKNIRLKVPRHGAQRINAKLSEEVRHQAKIRGLLIDPAQPSSKLGQAIVRVPQQRRRALTN